MNYLRVLTVIGMIVFLSSSCSTPKSIAARPDQLHIAAQSGDISAIETELKIQGDVDRSDGHGLTPLFYAISSVHAELVEYLLSKGADPNHQADNGETPLLIAVKKGNLPIVERLLQKGAQVDTFGEDGFTPLTISTGNGDKPIFDFLLSRGAKPDAGLPNCNTALIKAVTQPDTYFFDRLISAGANPSQKGHNGNTPLILAVYNLKPDMTHKLLDAGANVNDVNEAGYGALTFATGLTNIDPAIVRMLLEKGADVNQQAKDGLTPLKAACLAGHKDMAAFLYQNGAKPDFNDNTDEGIQLSGNIKHIMGDYFLAGDDMKSSLDYFKQAQNDNARLAEKYKGDVANLAWKQAGNIGLVILGSAFLAAAAAADPSNLGTITGTLAAQTSGPRSGKSASANGSPISVETAPEPQQITIDAYETYSKKYNQAYAPSYGPINMVFSQPPDEKSALSVKKAYANVKAKEFEEKTAYLGNIVACFDKNPKEGVALHACVNTIIEGYSKSHTDKQ
jgi:uncharacterized protein